MLTMNSQGSPRQTRATAGLDALTPSAYPHIASFSDIFFDCGPITESSGGAFHSARATPIAAGSGGFEGQPFSFHSFAIPLT
jgi:hypothetical protein